MNEMENMAPEEWLPDDWMMEDPFEDAEELGEAPPPAPDRWTIENDGQADWVLRKVREIDEDTEMWEKHYKAELERIRAKNQRKRDWWEMLLREYFRSVPTQETKTTRSYSLPTARLVEKKQGPKYEHTDSPEFVDWLMRNKLTEYVETKYSARWGDFKKQLPKGAENAPRTVATDDGLRLVTEDGEIIPGVTVENREPKFVVEFRKEGA